MATVLWAFAAAGIEATELFNAAARRALQQQRLAHWSPRSLTSAAWAYAKLKVRASTLFDAIDVAAAGRLDEFSARELVQLLWAFARSGVSAPSLFAQAAQCATRSLADYSPAELTTLAWAFHKAALSSPRFFDALAASLVARAFAGFDQELLSSCLHSLAWLGVAEPALYKAAAVAAAKVIGDFTPQQLARTVWAFAVADARACDECLDVLRRARARLTATMTRLDETHTGQHKRT